MILLENFQELELRENQGDKNYVTELVQLWREHHQLLEQYENPSFKGPGMPIDSTGQKQYKKKELRIAYLRGRKKVKYTGYPGSKNPRNQVGVIKK